MENKELVDSFTAALKRFDLAHRNDQVPAGYAFHPFYSRPLRGGTREWYKDTYPKYHQNWFNPYVGSWFGDLKARKHEFVKLRGRNHEMLPVLRSDILKWDAPFENMIHNARMSALQWRYKFDSVGKRQEFVQLKGNEPTTALVPWEASFAAKQAAKYGFVGPMPQDEFYGPTQKNATGYEYHTTMARKNAEHAERMDHARELHRKRRKRDRMSDIHAEQSYKFAMLDNDEQFIQGHMKSEGWTRDQATSVYFKNITENAKWLRIIAKNNPVIARNMIPIAKAVGKVSGLPFIGPIASNPFAALGLGAIIATSKILNESNNANQETTRWDVASNFYGTPTAQQEVFARAAGIHDLAKISEIYGKLNVKYGDADSFLRTSGEMLQYMSPREKQLFAKSRGMSPEEVMIAEYYTGKTPTEAAITAAKLSHIKDRETYGWRTGSGAEATADSMFLSIPWVKDFLARDKSPITRKFEEVIDTANSDDAYREGKYNNSEIFNSDNRKEVNINYNFGGVSIETNDPEEVMSRFLNLGNDYANNRYVAESLDPMILA